MNNKYNINKILFVVSFVFFVTKTNAQFFDQYIKSNITTKPFETIQQEVEAYYSNHFKGKGSGYKQWKRFEWWAAQHLEPNGFIADAGAKSIEANNTISTSDFVASSTGNWSVVGPTWNQGAGAGLGRPNCIAFNPVNNNLIYVGFPRGGMWAGFINVAGTSAIWIPMTDDLANTSISSIAVDPTNANIMYLLTGDGNRQDGFSTGLLKSTDGGYNWQTTGLTFSRTDGQFGFKILINPLKTSTLFVCTNGGIYKSNNAAQNFESVLGVGCYDIEYLPGDTNRLVACGFGSLFSSHSAGVAFTTRSANLPIDCRRTALAVSPNAPAGHVWLYCGGRDSVFTGGTWKGRYKGTYKSTDYGVTYTRINNAPNISGYDYDGDDFEKDQSNIDMDIAVSPTNSNIVLAGTHNVWRSTNAGGSYGVNPATHWFNTAVPYIHEDINFITYNNADGVLYCGSDGGVYRSTDNGVTWVDISKGLVISQFYRINVHPTNNNIIVNGAQDAAQNVRIGATSEFKEVANGGGDGMSCMIDFNNDDTIYTSYAENFYRSYNGGVTSVNIKPVADNKLWVTPMAMDYTAPSTIFFSSANPTQVYRSTNNGTSWSSIGGSANKDLISCPSNNTKLYGVTGNIIYRTLNATAAAASVSWSSISTGNTGFPQHLGAATSITRLSVNPTNSNVLWFCVGGYNDTLKVYRSFNEGNTWTNMSAGLPNVPVLSIACSSVGSNAVYVGTDIGVFYRDDNTGAWVPYRNGLPAVPVNDIRFNNGINKLRIATYGRGIWESDLYQTCASGVLVTGNLGGVVNFEAANSILATAQMEQGVGSKLQLKAGDYVRMQPGFKISGGSVMQATIAPCGGGFSNKQSKGKPQKKNRKNL